MFFIYIAHEHFIIIIFLHGLGRLACSGIDALPLIRRYPRLCVFAYEYFISLWEGYQPARKTLIFGGPVCLS